MAADAHKGEEILMGYVRLRDELKPVQIFITPSDGKSAEPINPDWVGVTRATVRTPRRTEPIEAFLIRFYKDAGECITWEQFDSLEIALDQAKAIVGIRHDEWNRCRVTIKTDDESVRWSEVAASAASTRAGMNT